MNQFLTPTHLKQRRRGVSLSFLLCVLCASFLNSFAASALSLGAQPEAASWPLAAETKVDSRGIFLRNVIAQTFTQPLPEVRIADAPAFGRAAVFTRTQLNDLLAKAAPELIPVWSGPDRVRVIRRNRVLDETEMRQMLTASL